MNTDPTEPNQPAPEQPAPDHNQDPEAAIAPQEEGDDYILEEGDPKKGRPNRLHTIRREKRGWPDPIKFEGLNFRVSERAKARVHDEAKRRHMTITELGRRIVDEYFDRRDRHLGRTKALVAMAERLDALEKMFAKLVRETQKHSGKE